MKLKVGILLLIILIIAAGLFFISNKKMNSPTIEINNITIKVEVVENQQDQSLGLGKRDGLGENQGMIFVYPDYKIRNFWMKDMKFSIDTIWILDDQVVGIEKNIPLTENGEIKRYHSPVPVNYVLEVTAGFSEKNNIKIGDKLNFNL